eukprot:12077455-Alexandrium_andersonii.AAC.1
MASSGHRNPSATRSGLKCGLKWPWPSQPLCQEVWPNVCVAIATSVTKCGLMWPWPLPPHCIELWPKCVCGHRHLCGPKCVASSRPE